MKRCLLAVLLVTTVRVASGADFIGAVKATDASAIEAALPKIKFEDWIHKNFKHGYEVSWEINDCGEGGDTINPRTPTCVEAIIPVSDGYTLHISSIIGVTTELEIVTPKLWMVYFYKAEGYKTLDVIMFPSISAALIEYHSRIDE